MATAITKHMIVSGLRYHELASMGLSNCTIMCVTLDQICLKMLIAFCVACVTILAKANMASSELASQSNFHEPRPPSFRSMPTAPPLKGAYAVDYKLANNLPEDSFLSKKEIDVYDRQRKLTSDKDDGCFLKFAGRNPDVPYHLIGEYTECRYYL
jgi:hypothetical protein